MTDSLSLTLDLREYQAANLARGRCQICHSPSRSINSTVVRIHYGTLRPC
jgi:hypothetical protein